MPPIKILKKPLPDIRTGNCAEDPTITDNHAQVMQHLCVQMELTVSGINDFMERQDQISQQMREDMKSFGNKVSDLRGEVARWHEETAVMSRDLIHLTQDVDRMGGKVRRIEARELSGRQEEAKEVKTEAKADRRMITMPILQWAIVFVVAMMVLGFNNYVKELASDQPSHADIRQIIQDEMNKP